MKFKKIMALAMVLSCALQINTYADDAPVIGEVIWQTKELVKISTEADLRDFAAKVNAGDDFSNKLVRLENDIVLDGNTEWTPIGNAEATPFSGDFDGKHHTIKNLKQTSSNSLFYGLFGYVKDGTVENVKLSNVYLQASELYNEKDPVFLGSVVSIAENSRLYYCNVLDGSIIATDAKLKYAAEYLGMAGGVVSYACNSSVYYCSNGAAITANGSAGGISAIADGGDEGKSIYQCFNKGVIRGFYSGAVISGICCRNNVSLSYCYNIGEVSSVGRFAAGISTENNGKGTIADCIDLNEKNTGYTTNAGTIEKLYYTNQTDDYKVLSFPDSGKADIIRTDAGISDYELKKLLNKKRECYALEVYGTRPVFYWEAQYNNGAWIRGDLTGEGEFTEKDITLMLKNLTGAKTYYEQKAADYNADGTADMKDVVEMMNCSRYYKIQGALITYDDGN